MSTIPIRPNLDQSDNSLVSYATQECGIDPAGFEPVNLEELVGGFKIYETEAWRLTFERFGIQFNAEEFLRVASDSLDTVIRAALFHGADLTRDQADALQIPLARAVSHYLLSGMRHEIKRKMCEVMPFPERGVTSP